MINSIATGHTNGYLFVDNGHSYMPYVSPNQNNPVSGMLRMNGSTMEVFDGNAWLQMSMANPSVSLSDDAINIFNWAKKKMEQEKEIEELAKEHQGVRELKEQVDLAQSKLDMFARLVNTKEEA